MFAPWRSQKSLRKHKDPITGNSYINDVWSRCLTLRTERLSIFSMVGFLRWAIKRDTNFFSQDHEAVLGLRSQLKWDTLIGNGISSISLPREKDQLTIGGAKTERQKREDKKIPNSSWEMENYHLYLVERNWKRFKRQCFFFLVQFNGEKLINFSATLSTDAEFVWGYYTKIVRDRFREELLSMTLFWQKNKSRHSMISLREDTTMIFEKSSPKPSTPDYVTRGSFKRIVQENRWRGSFEIIIFTPSWVVKRVWVLFTCE